MKRLNHIILIISILFLSASAVGQPSEGGMPASFRLKLRTDFPLEKLTAPDMEKIKAEDQKRVEQFKPARMAVMVDAGVDFSAQAQWVYHNETWTGRLAIEAENAQALIMYYNRFIIPRKGKLFLYSEDREFLIGAYTYKNNPSGDVFANEMVKGDKVILEYNFSGKELKKPEIKIGEVGYAYRYTGFESRGYGDSGDCQININCGEGEAWRDQQRGVARILIRRGGSAFWCSGTLINNVKQDYKPYLVTADHCGGDADVGDVMQWIFFFNYEMQSCDNTSGEPDSQSMVGAGKVANSGTQGNEGSDFYLVELNQYIPTDYDVYYNGWSRQEEAAQSGVTIHHPEGDVKKISTYTEPLTTASYANSTKAHWKVYWSETVNGKATTEPGSSGSPIFNESGQVVGLLTGGLSSCDNPDDPDYYGKFSYSWDKNGTLDEQRLEPWLDPDASEVVSMSGLGGNPEDILIADFEVRGDTSLPIGYAMGFKSMAIGAVVDWEWTFEGGKPGSSNDIDPEGIVYDRYGTYDVALKVTGTDGKSDTFVRKDYVRVKARHYPNPVTDKLTLDFGNEQMGKTDIVMYDTFGNQVYRYEGVLTSETSWEIDVSGFPAGIYVVHANVDGGVSRHKVLKVKTKE